MPGGLLRCQRPPCPALPPNPSTPAAADEGEEGSEEQGPSGSADEGSDGNEQQQQQEEQHPSKRQRREQQQQAAGQAGPGTQLEGPLDLPFTIPVPQSYEEFARLVAGRPSDQLTLAVQRIMAFNAAALATDHKRQLQVSCLAGWLGGCGGQGLVVVGWVWLAGGACISLHTGATQRQHCICTPASTPASTPAPIYHHWQAGQARGSWDAFVSFG